ncbi:MAG: hypothetical protein Fur0024_5220 [Patescibacteria group bacterium]
MTNFETTWSGTGKGGGHELINCWKCGKNVKSKNYDANAGMCKECAKENDR